MQNKTVVYTHYKQDRSNNKNLIDHIKDQRRSLFLLNLATQGLRYGLRPL